MSTLCGKSGDIKAKGAMAILLSRHCSHQAFSETELKLLDVFIDLLGSRWLSLMYEKNMKIERNYFFEGKIKILQLHYCSIILYI
jgi:hypothetical protein